MKLTRPALAVALTLVVAGACSDATPDSTVVARAGSLELSVDEIVALLVDAEDLPINADVVEAVAQLWIDYALLARAAAEDSTLNQLDFTPMVRAALDQELLMALGDSAIQLDTLISDGDVAARYESAGVDVQYRARHIMLRYPLQATAAQRDSVRNRLAEVRTQIVGGTAFQDLARDLSQDPGSAASGGDLGYFGPGDMVRPFEEAVTALEPGQLSEIVETPMGLHLIRLEERQRPALADITDQLRDQIRFERAQQAESLFVASVEERAGVRSVVEGAADVVRDLAANPSVRLSGRAARRPLVEWDGGFLSAQRVLDLLRLEPPAFQQQVTESPPEAVEAFLTALARRELLIQEARASGLEIPAARADSLATELSGQMLTATRRLGLTPLDQAPGERLDPAVRRAVNSALANNLSGATQTLPLGPISYQLRSGTPHATLNAGIGRAVLELGRQRATRGLSDQDLGAGTSPTTPDSVGS